jgi:propionyl-CoA synthetase
MFINKYFSTLPGHYNTGDSGYYDEDGYFHIMSREDDVINTAGHRLSTGEMEEILMKHEKIAEAIVIGAADEIKG